MGRKELLVVGLNRLSRGAAGNEDFDNRVAAETVAAVDAAGNLASRVQTRDHVVLSVQRVALVSTLMPPMVWWVDGAMKRTRSSTPSSL